MIRVVYTSRLRRELLQIVKTIARDNTPAAGEFVIQLEHLCSLLAITPAMGPLRPKVGLNVRSLGLGNYLIFYRWNSELERVDILSVWHGRRRFPRLRG
jgi:plasmid stabilization system protein ParE